MAAHADGVQTILVVGGVVVGARGRCATLVLGGSRGVVECIRDVGGACMWWMSHEGGGRVELFSLSLTPSALAVLGNKEKKKGKKKKLFYQTFFYQLSLSKIKLLVELKKERTKKLQTS
jgi:hypothetical protein